jgi:hypothetical protein
MISFPCHCGQRFSLEDDMAGTLVQCPRCGRLNDVPTHDDLAHIDQDGTYMLDQPVQDKPGRIDELRRIYHPGKVDDQGQEIDLRSYENLATEDELGIPLQPDRPPTRGIPKYDPETGELLRPINVSADADSAPPLDTAGIPMASPAPLAYARGETQHQVSPFKVPFLLLMPANAAVLFFIFIAHLIGYFILLVTVNGFLFVGPFILLVLLLIFSHYANVIEDIGPQESDELPRPMRSAGWREDIWGPFINYSGALLICYAPAIAITWADLPRPEMTGLLVLLLAAIGTCFLPAVMLTTTTSGSSMNLRPDRVAGVIRASGFGYVWALILWVAAVAVYLAGIGLLPMVARGLGLGGAVADLTDQWFVLLPMLAVGIYLMHLFCWHLGLLYRAHHLQFPWVLQRHEWTPRNPLPPRRQRRTSGQGAANAPANTVEPRQRLQQMD